MTGEYEDIDAFRESDDKVISDNRSLSVQGLECSVQVSNEGNDTSFLSVFDLWSLVFGL